jgi:hypothetical protein
MSSFTTISRTTLRLLALLFLLAGLLLLRKPLFGQSAVSLPAKPASQTITTAPTRFSVVIEGAARGTAPDVLLIPGLASSRDVYAAEANSSPQPIASTSSRSQASPESQPAQTPPAQSSRR